MIRIKRYIYFLAVCVCVPLLAACGDDDGSLESAIPADADYDFVTLVSSSSSGSVFEFRKVDDSPVVSYQANVDFTKINSVNDGDRLIICYKRNGGEIYTSGPIYLYGYIAMANEEQKCMQGVASDYDDWASRPFGINALWRTGVYINVNTEIYVFQSKLPESFVLVEDTATSDSAMPHLHMMYANKEGNDGDNPTRVYASFDISGVWERDGVEGVVVEYPTRDGSASQVFTKDSALSAS